MKWTTSNVKKSDYTSNHVIYIGTQTGSFKKLMVASKEDPFTQCNLQKCNSLDKDSRITALSYGDPNASDILIGRAKPTVQLCYYNTGQIRNIAEFGGSPIVGLGYFADCIIGAIRDGRIQCSSYNQQESSDLPKDIMKTGDTIDHMRQCKNDPRYVAMGGQGRQNNLKVIDLAADGKVVHSSKNLPHDYLQLEVPIWDSDIGFLESSYNLATCSRYGYVRVYDFRAQRRPVQRFNADDKFSFSTMATNGNSIGVGTTMGSMMLFDTRLMKTFVHKYKGFSGGVTNIHFDTSAKFIISACLDRYVRVHHVDTTELMYQCYVKSKPTCILICETDYSKNCANSMLDINVKTDVVEDKEYDEMFNNMQSVCETVDKLDKDEEEGNTLYNNLNLNDHKRKVRHPTAIYQKKKRKRNLEKKEISKSSLNIN